MDERITSRGRMHSNRSPLPPPPTGKLPTFPCSSLKLPKCHDHHQGERHAARSARLCVLGVKLTSPKINAAHLDCLRLALSPFENLSGEVNDVAARCGKRPLS